MKKTMSVIVTILVLIGAGAKFYTSYMGIKREPSNSGLTQLLGKSELEKAKAEFLAVIELVKGGDHQAVITKSTALIDKYKDNTDAKLRLIATWAMGARGESYLELKRWDEAESDFNAVIQRGKNTSELNQTVANAYFRMIIMQTENERITPEDALKKIDEYWKSYGTNSSLSALNSIMIGFKGSLQQKIMLLDEALASYQQAEQMIAELIAAQPDQSAFGYVLSVLRLEQVTVLGEKGETQAAFGLLEKVQSEIENNKSDKRGDLLVELAVTDGYVSLISAKLNWTDEANRTAFLTKGLEVLKDARTFNDQLNDAKEQRDNLAVILGNEAYIIYLQDDNRELAFDKLVEGLTLKGKKLYDATLRDISLFSIDDQDVGFKELVDVAWAKVQESNQ